LKQLARVPALATAPGASRQRAHPTGEEGLERLMATLAGVFTN
jgi:hypothetical protein